MNLKVNTKINAMTYDQLVEDFNANTNFYPDGLYLEARSDYIRFECESVYLFYNQLTGLTKIGISQDTLIRKRQIETMTGASLIHLLSIDLWKGRDNVFGLGEVAEHKS